MTKTLTAEYDATERVLRLDQPLEGVQDHAKVEVTVDESVPVEPKQSWRALSGSLSKEAGDSLARAHEEMFPPWNGNDD